jgi:hypothetical protein
MIIMKRFRMTMIALAALIVGLAFASCNNENDYDGVDTNNPSWTNATHPTSLANTKYVRTAGIKTSALGEDIQGFVESLDFVTADSVIVQMSQGATEGEWVNESNTERVPRYEYTYNETTGRIDILKQSKDDKGKVSKATIFTGTAISEKQELIAIVHFGDTPAQTYLVKQ